MDVMDVMDVVYVVQVMYVCTCRREHKVQSLRDCGRVWGRSAYNSGS